MTKNKGVALILTVIILTAVLAIALTAGKIFTDKIKMSRNTSDSMKAYYAAESRIECELYKLQHAETDCAAQHPDTEAEIGVDYIKAIGKAGEARRGIEVALAAATGGAIKIVKAESPDLWQSATADCGTDWGILQCGYGDSPSTAFGAYEGGVGPNQGRVGWNQLGSSSYTKDAYASTGKAYIIALCGKYQ